MILVLQTQEDTKQQNPKFSKILKAFLYDNKTQDQNIQNNPKLDSDNKLYDSKYNKRNKHENQKT